MNPTTQRTAAELFEEWRLDHEAAMNPCVFCLLERCPESEQAGLHALFDYYFDAPGYRSPPLSPVQMRRVEAKMAPILDRVMSDPGVVAHQDQLEAAWRDRPWFEKRWIRIRFWVRFGLVWRVKSFGRRKPWE